MHTLLSTCQLTAAVAPLYVGDTITAYTHLKPCAPGDSSMIMNHMALKHTEAECVIREFEGQGKVDVYRS